MDKQEVVHFLTTEENFRYANDNETDTLMWIQYPPNVPSNVKPIVIFPDEDYNRVTVHVSQFDRYGTYKSIDTEIKDNQAHVINLNAGVK